MSERPQSEGGISAWLQLSTSALPVPASRRAQMPCTGALHHKGEHRKHKLQKQDAEVHYCVIKDPLHVCLQ